MEPSTSTAFGSMRFNFTLAGNDLVIRHDPNSMIQQVLFDIPDDMDVKLERTDGRIAVHVVPRNASTSNTSSHDVQIVEESKICRYCLDDDDQENLCSPCRCTGTQAYVHRKCLDRWFMANGIRTCSVCKEDMNWEMDMTAMGIGIYDDLLLGSHDDGPTVQALLQDWFPSAPVRPFRPRNLRRPPTPTRNQSIRSTPMRNLRRLAPSRTPFRSTPRFMGRPEDPRTGRPRFEQGQFRGNAQNRSRARIPESVQTWNRHGIIEDNPVHGHRTLALFEEFDREMREINEWIDRITHRTREPDMSNNWN